MTKTGRGTGVAHSGGGLFSGVARCWSLNFLVMDALAAAAVIAVFVVALVFVDGFDDWLGGIPKENRHNLYGIVATIAGSMIGFGLAVVAFIMPAISTAERFRSIRRNIHYSMIPKTYLQTVYCFGGLTVTALAGLIADTSASLCVWIIVPFLFMGLLAIVRLYRSLNLLAKILHVMSLPHPNDRLPDQ